MDVPVNDQPPEVEFERWLESIRPMIVAGGMSPRAADAIVAEIRERIMPVVARPGLTLRVQEEMFPTFLQMQKYWWSGQAALHAEILKLIVENYLLKFGQAQPPARLEVIDGGKSEAAAPDDEPPAAA